MVAARDDHVEIVIALIKAGASVNLNSQVSCRSQQCVCMH